MNAYARTFAVGAAVALAIAGGYWWGSRSTSAPVGSEQAAKASVAEAKPGKKVRFQLSFSGRWAEPISADRMLPVSRSIVARIRSARKVCFKRRRRA